jgi:hypothetical protein
LKIESVEEEVVEEEEMVWEEEIGVQESISMYVVLMGSATGMKVSGGISREQIRKSDADLQATWSTFAEKIIVKK